MSCDDCIKKLAAQRSFQRSLLTRLGDACMAHGYELWLRPGGDAQIEVLALPTGPSHGTPEDIVAVFQELGGGPLPVSPARALQQRSGAPIAPDVTSTPGCQKWLVKGEPDILLQFRTDGFT